MPFFVLQVSLSRLQIYYLENRIGDSFLVSPVSTQVRLFNVESLLFTFANLSYYIKIFFSWKNNHITVLNTHLKLQEKLRWSCNNDIPINNFIWKRFDNIVQILCLRFFKVTPFYTCIFVRYTFMRSAKRAGIAVVVVIHVVVVVNYLL